MCRDPTAFLFDEPLSNLDAALRVEMRYEIAKLHQTLKSTMIYVTHDQVEAMTLADRIVVLEFGKIAQVGTPRELYEKPANLFVAQFIGSPRMNVFPASALPDASLPENAVSVGIRPEHLKIAKPPDCTRFSANTASLDPGADQTSRVLGADIAPHPINQRAADFGGEGSVNQDRFKINDRTD